MSDYPCHILYQYVISCNHHLFLLLVRLLNWLFGFLLHSHFLLHGLLQDLGLLSSWSFRLLDVSIQRFFFFLKLFIVLNGQRYDLSLWFTALVFISLHGVSCTSVCFGFFLAIRFLLHQRVPLWSNFRCMLFDLLRYDYCWVNSILHNLVTIENLI